MQRRFHAAHCAIILLFIAIENVQGQLPPDWKELAPDRLVKGVRSTIKLQGEEFDGRQQVAAHAWDRFLSNPEFITSGDWDSAHWLFTLFGDAEVDPKHESSKDRIAEAFAKRITSDRSVLTGKDLYVLGWELKQLERAGFTVDQKADAFAAWMDGNDWKSLELAAQYNLYSWVNADAVDRRHFSARWSGTITAPRTAEYTFRQVRQYRGTDSQLAVYLDNQLVLDSRKKEAGESRFESSPVALTGGQPVPIRVEMVHDVSRIDFSEGAPMAVLTWEAPGIGESIVPQSVFQPETSRAAEWMNGLTGEYFGDLAMTDLRASRVDTGLHLVSSWPPAISAHTEKADAVLAACKEKLLNPRFLATCAAEGDKEAFSYLLWRIAYRMSATERQQLVEALLSDTKVLAFLDTQMMARLYQAVYFLPSRDQVRLLGEWALLRPQPRCQPGSYPGWGEASYQKLNNDFYWLIGKFLQGPYAENVGILCSDYLIRPDGECNLQIAYACAYAGKNRAYRKSVLSIINKQLRDESLSGDALATWYIGRAFVEGVRVLSGPPLPLRGMGSLQEAHMHAQSEDHRFWAVQEMVSRKASCGNCQDALDLIERERGETRSSQSSALLDQWGEMARSLESKYAKRQEEETRESTEAYRRELKRRKAKRAAYRETQQ